MQRQDSRFNHSLSTINAKRKLNDVCLICTHWMEWMTAPCWGHFLFLLPQFPPSLWRLGIQFNIMISSYHHQSHLFYQSGIDLYFWIWQIIVNLTHNGIISNFKNEPWNGKKLCRKIQLANSCTRYGMAWKEGHTLVMAIPFAQNNSCISMIQ